MYPSLQDPPYSDTYSMFCMYNVVHTYINKAIYFYTEKLGRLGSLLNKLLFINRLDRQEKGSKGILHRNKIYHLLS